MNNKLKIKLSHAYIYIAKKIVSKQKIYDLTTITGVLEFNNEVSLVLAEQLAMNALRNEVLGEQKTIKTKKNGYRWK